MNDLKLKTILVKANQVSDKPDQKNPTQTPTGEWISNIDGQVVTVTECTTDVFWTAGGFNFKTDRDTFVKNYTPVPSTESPHN